MNVRKVYDMSKKLKKVLAYTDGACSGNPGTGGWGAILIYEGIEKELSGFEAHTTNNRMELKAAVEALSALKFPCEVDLFSDSSYLVNAFKENWIENWKRNGWRTSGKEDVKNRDLWERLDMLTGIHVVNWIKVKGHSDNEYNNRCDKLATNEIKKNRDNVKEDAADKGDNTDEI